MPYLSTSGFVFLICLALCVRDFIQDRKGRKYWLTLAALMSLLIIARFWFLPELKMPRRDGERLRRLFCLAMRLTPAMRRSA